VLTRRVTGFRGTPDHPLDQAGLREKFMMLTHRLDRSRMEHLFERLQQVETERDLKWIRV
jgi:2-methylcitrate dehydratase PrpD